MDHAYAYAARLATGALTLSPAESHHLCRVRRVRPGDRVSLLDGHGGRADGTVETAATGGVVVTVTDVGHAEPPRPRVELLVGLPKGKAAETIVQKATELGVTAVTWLAVSHSEVDLDAERAEKRRARWAATVREAAKQSGQPWWPSVDGPVRWRGEALLPELGLPDASTLGLVASLEAGSPALGTVVAAHVRRGGEPAVVRIVIGPEGALTATEEQALVATGYQPVSLGPAVLRTETAAVTAVAQLAGALAARRT